MITNNNVPFSQPTHSSTLVPQTSVLSNSIFAGYKMLNSSENAQMISANNVYPGPSVNQFQMISGQTPQSQLLAMSSSQTQLPFQHHFPIPYGNPIPLRPGKPLVGAVVPGANSIGFKRLLAELKARQFDLIRFAAYRTASKLRYLQQRTLFCFMDLWRVVETFREFGLHQVTDQQTTLDYAGTGRLLARIYSELVAPAPAVPQTKPAQRPTQPVDPNLVNLANEVLLSWLIYALDVCATGRLTVNSLKIALSTLANAKPSDKFRYHFTLLSDPSGALIQAKFEIYLQDLLRLPISVFEGTNFFFTTEAAQSMWSGFTVTLCAHYMLQYRVAYRIVRRLLAIGSVFDPTNFYTSLQTIILKPLEKAKNILIEEFLERMMADPGPQLLVWLTIFHRLAAVENKSLFTNVPRDEYIEFPLSYMRVHHLQAGIPESELEKLLLFCTKNLSFVFQDSGYRQIDGVAMDSPLCPNLADGFVAKLEQQPFEDGDVRMLLENMEDVAEVVGVKTDRGTLAALRTLVKSRAKAVLDAARRGPAKMEWAAAKEAMVAAFDSPADRQEVMQRFKATRLGQGADPPVFATTLQGLLDRALPVLDQEPRRQLLTEQFIEGLPVAVRDQVRIAHVVRPMDFNDLAKVTRELAVMSVTSVDANSNTDKKTLEEMRKAMEQLAADVSALRTASRKNDQPGGCFICRSENKVFRECCFCWAGQQVMGAIGRGAVHTRVEVDGEVEQCLVDTGAAISLIARAEKQNLEPTPMMIRTVGETRQTTLGADFLAAKDAVIDLKLKKLSTRYGSLTFIRQRKDSVTHVRKVKTLICTAPLLQSTVEKYSGVFTNDDDPYGFCNWIAHEIPTIGTFRPHGPRRILVHLEEELRRQIQNMLSEDKSTRKYRFCVDFRRLNEVTRNTVVPIPSVADILDKLQQAKLFTVLD
ncbi:uncharacterized protein DEA37_0012375 [Paragonimus westermani]|uniref:Peptidase A2 domain-containing protein n=1 Tax=Paragonimus westermani TaxID=34504 RepID=A0A5J4P440_9TREM|nr:uncharacterized protein DEA37_0012375 [Paragonimus westermani]